MNRVHDKRTQNELWRWVQLNGAFISTFDRFEMNWNLPNHLAIRIFGCRFWFEWHMHTHALHRHKIIIDSEESVRRTIWWKAIIWLWFYLWICGQRHRKHPTAESSSGLLTKSTAAIVSNFDGALSTHKKWYVKTFLNNAPLTHYSEFEFVIRSNKNTVHGLQLTTQKNVIAIDLSVSDLLLIDECMAVAVRVNSQIFSIRLKWQRQQNNAIIIFLPVIVWNVNKWRLFDVHGVLSISTSTSHACLLSVFTPRSQFNS